MGRSISFLNASGRRGGALARLGFLLALSLAAATAHAQTSAPASTQPASTQPVSSQAAAAAQNPDKLIVEANELVYDKDHNTVSAVGAVQLYYKHRILQADRVVYNRTTKRVYAEGHAKLTDEHGNVSYARDSI